MNTLIDRHFGTTEQGYRLTRVDRIGGHTIRVRVHRDNRASQSHAIAEVLTPQLTWTDLCSDLPSGWFDASPHYTAPADTALDTIAAGLLRRAAAILGVTAPAANPAAGRVLGRQAAGRGA
ncbi:hypothetical protein [Longispora albida]|uniref:hypothetical protein n=1 Tax=Longispora albida TaxID=203523 RepID=UPI00036C57F6|nr:hypothetical protein [Longispora albida]